MTERDVPQSREAVDVLLAVGVNQQSPVTAHPHVAAAMGLHVVEGMDEGGEVPREQVADWIHDLAYQPVRSVTLRSSFAR